MERQKFVHSTLGFNVCVYTYLVLINTLFYVILKIYLF